MSTTRPAATRASPRWSIEDDATLVEAKRQGHDWKWIARTHFLGKTDNACRKRHDRIVVTQRAEDFDGPRLEDLAQAYQEVRREMWTILGDRLDEHWEIVEKKCMEKGVKNLRATARSSSMYAHAASDSGISMGEPSPGFYDRRPSPRQPTIASMLSPPQPQYSPQYSDFRRSPDMSQLRTRQ